MHYQLGGNSTDSVSPIVVYIQIQELIPTRWRRWWCDFLDTVLTDVLSQQEFAQSVVITGEDFRLLQVLFLFCACWEQARKIKTSSVLRPLRTVVIFSAYPGSFRLLLWSWNIPRTKKGFSIHTSRVNARWWVKSDERTDFQYPCFLRHGYNEWVIHDPFKFHPIISRRKN